MRVEQNEGVCRYFALDGLPNECGSFFGLGERTFLALCSQLYVPKVYLSSSSSVSEPGGVQTYLHTFSGVAK